ncbi:hypothetical protein [uncultured Bradyrhizobium sp.]|nr:hypothetical protein [uncultured Bradyrhizobium sp.]
MPLASIDVDNIARAADPDTLVASAKAYLGALNKIVMKRQRDVPATKVAG